MKNKNTMKAKKLSKKQIVLILFAVLVLGLAGFVLNKLTALKEVILKEDTLGSLSINPTSATTFRGNLFFGNEEGYVVSITPAGKRDFSKKIDNKVFNIVNDANGPGIFVAGIKYHYLDSNFNEVYSVGFDNYIPREPYVSFLTDGTYKLVFQSLKDLSYLIVKIDKNGKVLSKDVIPDMGQNSCLSIAKNGLASFALESGDVYILDGSYIIRKTSISNKQESTVSNIFCIYTDNSVIVGYKTLIQDENKKNAQKLSVYFYDSTLSRCEHFDFDSGINSIYNDNRKIVFVTNSGFYFFDSSGKLLNSVPKIDDFVPYRFIENSKTRAFVYRNENAQGRLFYQIILEEKNGREIGRFVRAFSVDNPIFVLSDTEEKVYLLEGVNVKILSKY